jgi:hypothetical protein
MHERSRAIVTSAREEVLRLFLYGDIGRTADAPIAVTMANAASRAPLREKAAKARVDER